MLLLLLLVFVDQVSKWLAQQFSLVTWNEGLSLGMGRGFSGWSLNLGLVIFLALAGWWLWQRGKHRSVAGTFILAGAISNVIDRLMWGAVRDWLPVPFINMHNNLADWLIVMGAGWLLKEAIMHYGNSVRR